MRFFINLVAVSAFGLMLLLQEAIAVERHIADTSKGSDTVVDFNKPRTIDSEQMDAARKSTSSSDDGRFTAGDLALSGLSISQREPEFIAPDGFLKWTMESLAAQQEALKKTCKVPEDERSSYGLRLDLVPGNCISWTEGCNIFGRTEDGGVWGTAAQCYGCPSIKCLSYR